jgi:hypothetical protein
LKDSAALRQKLRRLLGSADEVAFLRMIWTLNALQTGRADVARRFLGPIPSDAEIEGILGPQAVYPWELETLVNEFLMESGGIYRTFNCRNWNEIGQLVNLLRSLENAEYGSFRNNESVFVEMGRIGARQFPWQRGFVSKSSLYRSSFIFGQGECAAFMEDVAGLSAQEMTLVGFALLSVFYPEPAIRPAIDLDLIHTFGIDLNNLTRTLARIACPLNTARERARLKRTDHGPTAYQPSVLREFPCILIGHRSRSMIAPLPDLIMDRVTNGLFYDVVGGGRAVREETGRRFEAYSLELLRRMLPTVSFAPETRYLTRLGEIASPDIQMTNDRGEVLLSIECKASRMSIKAQFGDLPEEDRGYEEIAKGVMQLWRFHAHARAKTAPMRLTTDVQLMVLTLDEWFAGRSKIIPKVIARAHALADASPHLIPAEDRRAVGFCTISELEEVLTTATAESLQGAVRIASGDKAGWMFSKLHQDMEAQKTGPKDFPFEEALSELLPWFGKVRELGDGD